MRAEIREKSAVMRQLLGCEGGPSKEAAEKVMMLAQEKMELVEKLNIRLMFVYEMVNLYFASRRARRMGISAPDPETFKQKALESAQKFGESTINYCNHNFNNY